MSTTTPARDRLCAFYAAHPDVPNADGEQLLALPKTLLGDLNALLVAACTEKLAPRVVDFRTGSRPRDGKGRYLPTFTLTYEAILSGGEVVRFVRDLSASGVETIGRKLTSIDFDDPRIDNIAVTDRSGGDVTFNFACFAADEWPTGTPEQQEIAIRLLTFIPPAAA